MRELYLDKGDKGDIGDKGHQLIADEVIRNFDF